MPILSLTPIGSIPLVKPGDDLSELILHALYQAGITLIDGDIVAVTSKVISKAEGRFVNLVHVVPSKHAKTLAEQIQKDPRIVELILKESKAILRTRPGTIIVEHRLGFVCANAGIDHSNVAGEGNPAEEWVVLLPENPNTSAEIIRSRLEAASGVNIGVLVVDSHGRAWRMGTVGVAIGLSGMPALIDLRGLPDIFGYKLQVTQVGAADELAAAASLVMGQVAEEMPVVHVRGFPYPLRDGNLRELIRPRDSDLFR